MPPVPSLAVLLTAELTAERIAQAPHSMEEMPEAMPEAMPMQQNSGSLMTATGLVLGAVVLIVGTAIVTRAIVTKTLRSKQRVTFDQNINHIAQDIDKDINQDINQSIAQTHPVNPPDQESAQLTDNQPLTHQPLTDQPVRRSILSVKTLSALGVFVVLTGGIATATSLLKPASLMAGMDGMEGMAGMSMEDMMRVDGSFNPVPVTVETVEPSLLETSVRYTGSVRPYLEVAVYPRVEGQLTEYTLYPGDAVAAGQVLARLNAAERSADVAEMIAETRVSQAELQVAQAEITEQQREVERMAAEYDFLAKEVVRAQVLVTQGAISRSEFDRKDSEATAARAALSSAQTKLERMQAQVNAAAAKVAQTQVRSDRATILENYTAITAPITGIVQERMVDPGVFVQPGMAILKIGDYRRVRLQANVAQQDALQIKVGSAIVARLPGAGTETIPGKVTSIFPMAGEATRTVMIEAVVDNPGQRLAAGQFLEMNIITARKPGALSVPQSAITLSEEESTVWVMEDGMAKRRVVTTGLMSGDRIEVTRGLKPGELVITTGSSRLVENAKVVAIDASGNPVASLNDASQGSVQIQLISPEGTVAMGDNQLILQVQDATTGEPLPVRELNVNVAMPMPNMAPMQTEVEVKPADQPGRFQVNTYFGMRGTWQVTANVKDEEQQGQATFTLEAQ
ncbi:efflux RND transporter periplasmic adaptor subunit [Leptolyngbya sp. AN02str]|jgi:multidrug efflux pump subunit AcrA (membrane-fusion protein)|uniref:efflux RND transporter periplasmic adaptor subunit n=1 Tax=Leptolyngbya sp. AN02str TaxID=3423363 RepID=UPI003D31D3A2